MSLVQSYNIYFSICVSVPTSSYSAGIYYITAVLKYLQKDKLEGTNINLPSVLWYSEGFFKSQTVSEMLSVENKFTLHRMVCCRDQMRAQTRQFFQVRVGKLEIMNYGNPLLSFMITTPAKHHLGLKERRKQPASQSDTQLCVETLKNVSGTLWMENLTGSRTFYSACF